MERTISDAPAEPMIVIENLVKRFGPFRAVDGVSFSVSKGEVLGFLGPNGAGKSTTMKMVTGVLTPGAGRIRICGHCVSQNRLAAQKRIGYLPEGAPAYPDMTPHAFLRFMASVRGLRGATARKAIDHTVQQTEIGSVMEQPIDTLSKGFCRRVGIAQAILHDPPVLIMDEPTDGLDPNQKQAVRRLINAMAPRKAIIISTHILEEVEAICSRALLIDRGKIITDGTPASLMARSRYHNAVTLVMPTEETGKSASLLGALHEVATLESVTRGEDTAFTMLSKQPVQVDTALIDAVARLAREENWTVRALNREPGRLEEVFHRLTRPDTDNPGTREKT